MHNVEHERFDDEHPIKSFPVDELRKAAAHLAKPDAREHVSCPPIPKPLLAALFEAAFPDAPPRGLAYPQEVDDIQQWLVDVALDDNIDADERMLASCGAWMCDRYSVVLDGGQSALELARAIAKYFLHNYARTVASILADDGRGEL